MKIEAQEALGYHGGTNPGKIGIRVTKPVRSQRDLSLAYTPGVAVPCREIYANPAAAFEYTAKRNLVAVVSNGTAVLGLGDIGPLAAKPAIEGKAVLFNLFGGVDAIDIEIDGQDPGAFCETVRRISPTFGGINLEDIRSPDCFAIERELQKTLSIPVFHDDSRGTALLVNAALLNALELTGRDARAVSIVISGTGAGAIATAELLLQFGVPRGNIVLCDSRGVVRSDNPRLAERPYLAPFATDLKLTTLEDALRGADVLIGLSVGGLVSSAMVTRMKQPAIVFALANPDPEISPHEVLAACKDAIVATGRSDYPNQINNVLGFPFLFRGALDVQATMINVPMMMATARALAEMARTEVPERVLRAYGFSELRFGPEYLLPKPFDPRLASVIAPAVARAAMESGTAGKPIPDFAAYSGGLQSRQSAYEVPLPLLPTDNAYYSCFISYSHADTEFVARLSDDLERRGIPCWLDEKQMKPGMDLYHQVNENVRRNERVLLCASRSSLRSWWVDAEIAIAVEQERQITQRAGQAATKIIPLNLDGYMFSEEWTSQWAPLLRRRFAADFSDSGRYERELERLISALRRHISVAGGG